MNSCMLTVVCFSMLQHKLILLLPKGTLKDNFSVGILIRANVKWPPANVSDISMNQQLLILPATINCTKIHIHHFELHKHTIVRFLSNLGSVSCRLHTAFNLTVGFLRSSLLELFMISCKEVSFFVKIGSVTARFYRKLIHCVFF